MTTIIDKAKAFATSAHGDQRRRYTHEPYVNHPIAVSEIVASVTDDESMIAAAILHDTVEDTDTELQDIRQAFGERVAELVENLTDISSPADGNRAQRKAVDRAHTAQASADAQTIKLADLIHNAESISGHDPGFARIYMQEKRELLKVLNRGNADLYSRACQLVEAYFDNPYQP